MSGHRCPHCGAIFDAAAFEAHIQNVARAATQAAIVDWLYRLGDLEERA